ncbi:MAG: ribulose-phosphate 3-epimerase [Planctomycetota bacterium]
MAPPPDNPARSLRAAAPVVLPSLLAADFGVLEREVHAAEEAGAQALHLDVMDGHFVPNLSFGLPVVRAIRRATGLPLDVHLMITNPGEYAERYREAGADIITFHAEVVDEPAALLEEIRGLGAGAGLSLNPPTPIEQLEPALPHCDLVLVMSVMPGFGGQAFNPVALDKLRWLRDHPACNAVLEVDGGVNAETVADCAAAGAELLVAGTAVFGTARTDSAAEYAERIRQLTHLAIEGRTAPAAPQEG